MSQKNIERLIQAIEQIPTLPIVSQQVMLVLEDKNVSIKKLSELIEKDQALAVKILKVANSAFYATLSKVSSIDHALVILGLQEVKGILMAFSIHNFFSQTQFNGFDRERFWKHSMICSQIAKYLEQHFRVQKDETLFLAGLIHDMGKIVFDQYFHEEFLEIIDYVSTNNTGFSKAEKEILGITHYQVAAKLLQKWNFPEKLIMHVFYHHAPWHDENYVSGSIIIYLSNLFTKLVGYPCHPSERKVDLIQFAHSKVMDFIVQNGFDLDYDKIERMANQIREFISLEAQNALSLFEE